MFKIVALIVATLYAVTFPIRMARHGMKWDGIVLTAIMLALVAFAWFLAGLPGADFNTVPTGSIVRG